MKGMRSRRARILGWVAVGASVALVIAAVGVFIAIRVQLSGINHIKQIDVAHRPQKYTDAINILLLGSDTRTGSNGKIGGPNGCNCSDTIMVAHISPGHKRVTVLSIPRDTVVPLYACSPTAGLPGQSADPYAVERINATLAAGGPECVRETVEQQTGIYIDEVIELNFTGFEQVINDIGGVNVCLPFAIHNTITASYGSGLDLKAGEHHINGRVALEFWRTRYNVANGSDIERIARDQYLMAQIVKGVLHSHLLGSPSRMFTVIGDVANALTTDATDTQLLHIALSLHGISLGHVQFLTAPWTSYPYDPNEVEFSQPQANAVFWAIAHDTALPPGAMKPHRRHHHHHVSTSPVPASPMATVSPAGSPSPSASASPGTVTPSQVSVMLLDGSTGASQTAAADTALTKRGFTVTGTGYAPSTDYQHVVIEYGAATDLPAALLVKKQFSIAKLRFTRSVAAGTIEVILGSKFKALAPPAATSPTSIGSLAAQNGGITARARCRNSAFYGTYDASPPPGQVTTCAC